MRKHRLIQLAAVFIFPLTLAGCFHQPTVRNDNLNRVEPLNQNTSSVPLNNEPDGPAPNTFPFSSSTPSPVFRDSTPQSQDILPQAPLKVVIDSSVQLTEQSTLSIINQGVEYGVGKANLNESKTTLNRNMSQTAPPGLYTVNYSLCEVAAPCSTGVFQFAIDSFWLTQYQNWTHLSPVEVSLNGSAFLPRYLHVSAGTTVTWKNEDQVLHTVDSDPYSTHSYNPSLSSFELKPGETYSFTFGTPGLYPYRCSVHPQSMTGVVLVE